MDQAELKRVMGALGFAARKHEGQVRKDNETPYFAHPARVVTVLTLVFGVRDADTLTAAALHDTIEDTTTDHDDLSERFGRPVADTVAWLTKDKRLPEPEREAAYFEGLCRAPLAVKLCKLADVFDNLMDSQSLTAERRREKLAQARELLDAFTAELQADWGHALDAVRRQIDETAKMV